MTDNTRASAETSVHTVWVGSYTSDSGRDGVGIGSLSVTVSPVSGVTASDAGIELAWTGAAVAAPSPSFLAAHPELPIVYAAQEADRTVRAFRQTSAAALEPYGEAWPAGSAVCHVAVDRDARFLMATCWGDGRVLLYELDSDGAIVSRAEAAGAADPYAALALAVVPVEGQAPRQSRAHASLMLADGRVMTTDLGFDLVRVWRYAAAALVLDHEVALPFGSGPRHLVQHPDGTVFVVTEYSIEVVALQPAAAAPAAPATAADATAPGGMAELDDAAAPVPLPRFAVTSIGPATAEGARPGDAAAEIVLSPDARFVYVSVRGSNRISTLSVDAAGRLRPIADVQSGGDRPRHHVVLSLPVAQAAATRQNTLQIAQPAPTRQNASAAQEVAQPIGVRRDADSSAAPMRASTAVLLVAHERSSDVSVFAIDAATGILQPRPSARLSVAAPTALIPGGIRAG